MKLYLVMETKTELTEGDAAGLCVVAARAILGSTAARVVTSIERYEP